MEQNPYESPTAEDPICPLSAKERKMLMYMHGSLALLGALGFTVAMALVFVLESRGLLPKGWTNPAMKVGSIAYATFGAMNVLFMKKYGKRTG